MKKKPYTIVVIFLYMLFNVTLPVSAKTHTKCLQLGQSANVGGMPSLKGWKLPIPCCAALKDRESISICDKGSGGGYTYSCIACGDKKCDSKFESRCNCPEDCRD